MSHVLENSPQSTDRQSSNSSATADETELGSRAEQKPSKPTFELKRRMATILGSLAVVMSVVGILAGIAWVKTKQIQAAMSAPPPPEMPIAVSIGNGRRRPVPPADNRRRNSAGAADNHRTKRRTRNDHQGIGAAGRDGQKR